MKITSLFAAFLAMASSTAWGQTVDAAFVSSIVTALKSVRVSEFLYVIALTLISIWFVTERLI